jgi:hypothetical protein
VQAPGTRLVDRLLQDLERDPLDLATSSPSFTRPMAIPAQALRSGTDASISASDPEHTEAIDEEPLDSRMSETTRMV